MKKPQRKSNRGSFSAMIAIIAVSLVGLGGLVFDGGRVVSTYLEISDDAANAARIGTQQIVNIRAGEPIIDVERSHIMMSRYLLERGYQSSVFVEGIQITVSISKRVPMKVLNMFGVGYRTVTVQRTVQAVSQ